MGRGLCYSGAKFLKPIASACVWPPNLDTKEIILTLFFAYSLLSIHSLHSNNHQGKKQPLVESQCIELNLPI